VSEPHRFAVRGFYVKGERVVDSEGLCEGEFAVRGFCVKGERVCEE